MLYFPVGLSGASVVPSDASFIPVFLYSNPILYTKNAIKSSYISYFNKIYPPILLIDAKIILLSRLYSLEVWKNAISTLGGGIHMRE